MVRSTGKRYNIIILCITVKQYTTAVDLFRLYNSSDDDDDDDDDGAGGGKDDDDDDDNNNNPDLEKTNIAVLESQSGMCTMSIPKG